MINPHLLSAALATSVENACHRVAIGPRGREDWIRAQLDQATRSLDRYLSNQGYDLSEQSLIEVFDQVGR